MYSKAVPGSGLDTSPELIVSQEVLNKLLAREELLTPQQHLQMYNSPLDISMDFGKRRMLTQKALQLSYQTSYQTLILEKD